jgi:enoyl-CoA hydratase
MVSTLPKAVEIRLINHALPADALDAAIDAFCARLLSGATRAIRWAKIMTNVELKRIACAVMDDGTAYESLSVRTADHREGIAALEEKRPLALPGLRFRQHHPHHGHDPV